MYDVTFPLPTFVKFEVYKMQECKMPLAFNFVGFLGYNMH